MDIKDLQKIEEYFSQEQINTIERIIQKETVNDKSSFKWRGRLFPKTCFYVREKGYKLEWIDEDTSEISW